MTRERESQGPRLRRVELWSRKGAGESSEQGAGQGRGGAMEPFPSLSRPGSCWAMASGHWAVGSHQWIAGSGRVTLANVGKCKWVSASGE